MIMSENMLRGRKENHAEEYVRFAQVDEVHLIELVDGEVLVHLFDVEP